MGEGHLSIIKTKRVKMKMNRKGDIQQCSLGWGTHIQNLLGLDNYKSTNRYPAKLAMDSRCILARIRVN